MLNDPPPPPPVDLWRDPTYPDHVRWHPFPPPDPAPPAAPCWPGCPVCADEGTAEESDE